jgi:CelD/BcsL family acetyltransferase involved in cellulose biosynthesis
LFDSMPHPGRGHVYENVVVYLDTFVAEPDRFTCLVLSDGSGVRGICPLERRTERFFGIPIEVSGLPWNRYWNQADLICADDDAASEFVPAIVDHLRRSAHPAALLVLGPLPEHSAVWAGLESLDRTRFCTHALWFSDIVDCDRPFEEVESRWTANFRNNLRRLHRRLLELEGVEFVSAADPQDLDAEFEAFMRVEASGWKGENGTGTAIALDATKIDSYRALIEGPGHAGFCEFNSIYAEGKCIASWFCVRAGEELTTLKIGFDEDYKKVAPGQVLQRRMIEQCCADPDIRRLDLMSDYRWHRDWSPRKIATQQVDVAVGRWTGRPAVALFRFQWSVQRLVRWLRVRFRGEPTRWRGPR